MVGFLGEVAVSFTIIVTAGPPPISGYQPPSFVPFSSTSSIHP